MNSKALLLGLMVVCFGMINAQHPTILELESNTQGFLPPVMNQAQMAAIGTPIAGLLVYCTDCAKKGPHFFDGSQWVGNFYREAESSGLVGSTSQDPILVSLQSTTQVFLLPRMTKAEMLAISSPTQGLMIYCTDCENGRLQISGAVRWDGLVDPQLSAEITQLQAEVNTLQNILDNPSQSCSSYGLIGIYPNCLCDCD